MNHFSGYVLRRNIPSKDTVIRFAETLRHYLFPIVPNEEAFHAEQDRLIKTIELQLKQIVDEVCYYASCNSERVVREFSSELDAIRSELIEDAEAMLKSDPAAYSLEEVIVAYPGFTGILAYRISNRLHRLGLPIVPRIITEWAHALTGIDIHPGASIEVPFIIDHGTGIVIGETTKIGKNVRIYQGVTLGALAVVKGTEGKRHPTIEDNVILYANSTILGGNTVIGENTIIGGNCFITKSVPSNSVAYHRTQVTIRTKQE